jgi:hypothetical protein
MNDISDTSPEFQNFQIDLLRKKTVQECLTLTVLLSETAMSLAHRALKRAMPESSESDRKIKFIEFHYGKDLSERYKSYVTEREK